MQVHCCKLGSGIERSQKLDIIESCVSAKIYIQVRMKKMPHLRLFPLAVRGEKVGILVQRNPQGAPQHPFGSK
jgi:hypothetical protein